MLRSRPDLPVPVKRSRAALALVVASGLMLAAHLAAAQENDAPPAAPAPVPPRPTAGPITRTAISRVKSTVQQVNAQTARTNQSAAPPVTGTTAKPAPAVASPARTPANVAARPAAANPRSVTTVGGKTAPTVVVPKMAPQEERVTYQYNALGRRDPFQALIGGGFVGIDVGGAAPPDVGGLKVVGIVWGTQDKFALVEDPRGNSMVLRQGDKVMNGVVEALKRDAVVIKLSTDGQTQSVEIPLTQKGEQSQ